MRVTPEKKQDYLGMILDYSRPGEVMINMADCVQKMYEDFPCQKE